tara:strand:- start:2041 stop:2478 length:438 start_codon:yes stop_codon:yes gene_type:complete
MARTRDELHDAVDRVMARYITEAAINKEGDDTGLDSWFEPRTTYGFRIAKEKIVAFDGYTFGEKADLIGQKPYEDLSEEDKALIPESPYALFFLIGKIEGTDEWVYTHWLQEDCRFAQKVACDWWDSAEGDVLEDWGIEYDDIED